jgi:hypothetical protein
MFWTQQVTVLCVCWTQKCLSAIKMGRLYRLSERHSLLDPSQEGFRRLRSTQRQVQSLNTNTEAGRFRGEPLTNLAADEAFAYLGVRASLIPPSHHTTEQKCKVGLAPCLKAEKDHVYQRTQDITSKIRYHKYLLCRMVSAMCMAAASRFRYCALLVPWTDAELDALHSK